MISEWLFVSSLFLVGVACFAMGWMVRDMRTRRVVRERVIRQVVSKPLKPEIIGRTKCGVDGCKITRPHSHAQDLIRRLRDE